MASKEASLGFDKLNKAELETLSNMLNHAAFSIMEVYRSYAPQDELLQELWPVYREASIEFYSR